MRHELLDHLALRLAPSLQGLYQRLAQDGSTGYLNLPCVRLPLSRLHPGWPDLSFRLPSFRLRLAGLQLWVGDHRQRHGSPSHRLLHGGWSPAQR